MVDWYLPKSTSVTKERAERFGNVVMHRVSGEEPMKSFARVDETTSVLAYFGVIKPENAGFRKVVRGLSEDYSLEPRKFIYEESVSGQRVENIVRQRYVDIAKQKNGRNRLYGIFFVDHVAGPSFTGCCTMPWLTSSRILWRNK